MKNRLWKGWIFGFIIIAIIGLIYSPGYGQISQDYSLQYGDLFNYYTVDSDFTLSPFSQSYSYDTTMTNPFAAVSNQSSYYGDLFSTSSDRSFSYQNAFGFGFSTGTNMYSDPFYSSGGGYINVGAPGASYSSDYDYSRSIFGGSDHYENTLILPWTYYSAEVNTSYGMDALPYGEKYAASSSAYGLPTVFDMAGGTYGGGVLSLMAFAPVAAQMDRELGNRPMYTADGMRFYATASYMNPYNASRYFFDQGTRVTTGGIGAGYAGGVSGYTGSSSSWVTGAGQGISTGTGEGSSVPAGWSAIVYP